MQKKKILYIHHSGRLGGAPKSLSLLLEKIDKTRFEPIILALQNGPAIEMLKKTGAKVIVKPWLFPFHGSTVSGMPFSHLVKNYLFVIPTFFGARRIIKKINPDFIHLNSTCLFTFAAAAKSINKKLKVITHVREPLLLNLFGKILKVANYRYTDGYVSICKNDQSRMLLKNKPATVVYNFINFSDYNPGITSRVLRDELQLKNDAIICLSLARISKPNGILELIERFKALNKSFTKFKLVVVGLKQNNSYEKKCIEAAKSNPNIFLLPFRTDATALIASSDIMLCSFTAPHFSRAIIEASAMGKPTLGNNIGGVDELIDDAKTGYLFNIHSQQDFEEKLSKLKDEKQREVLGRNGYSFAQANFDAEKNAQATFKFYEQFLEL
ncbi:glycosyltransferase family 4 protein [uncultured Draconibacterium sp.]|uniref:glycosyltransferase family 4 protein n=1 Tax=uncultured Draconibacterium sp. TaxID=1573823 RepID=UPI0032615E3E